MSYIKESEEAVLLVLNITFSKKGRPVSASEITDESHNWDLPVSATYTPFTFRDRLLRWLRRLVRKGHVEETRKGSRFYFSPTIPMGDKIVDSIVQDNSRRLFYERTNKFLDSKGLESIDPEEWEYIEKEKYER